MLLTLILACEVAFWVVLGGGLAVRYGLGRPRLGALLLLCVPLVDVVLLTATVLHLRTGATADFTHGMAAAYLGFTVAFGHSLVRWADARVAHRLAGGPEPARPPRGGAARARHEWATWLRTLLAWGIACALLTAAIVAVDDPGRTAALGGWIQGLSLVLAVALLWPLRSTLTRQ